jgi:hypothetical protein
MITKLNLAVLKESILSAHGFKERQNMVDCKKGYKAHEVP